MVIKVYGLISLIIRINLVMLKCRNYMSTTKSSFYPTLIPLALVNLVPLYGVLVLGWDIFDVFFLFWIETAVIGFYSLCKLIRVAGFASVVLVPFFVVHFGMFMMGHLSFIFALFNSGLELKGFFPTLDVIMFLIIGFWVPILLFVISHGVSFYQNFLKAGEHIGVNAQTQMMAPYGRVVVMHLTIILGGFVAQILGAPMYSLVMLIFIKIYIDSRAHVKEHSSRPVVLTSRTQMLSAIATILLKIKNKKEKL